MDAVSPFSRRVGRQDFQDHLVPADGKRELGRLHGQVHVLRVVREHDAEPGDLGVHLLPPVVRAEIGLELLQASHERLELAVHPLQHRGQRGELPVDSIRHPQFGLVSHFMADVGPGVFQQRADLNLGLQSQDFRRRGQRDAGLPQLLRIGRHDVVDRAVAELGGPEALAHVLAVGPIDGERLLDELADRPDLVRRFAMTRPPQRSVIRSSGSADKAPLGRA